MNLEKELKNLENYIETQATNNIYGISAGILIEKIRNLDERIKNRKINKITSCRTFMGYIKESSNKIDSCLNKTQKFEDLQKEVKRLNSDIKRNAGYFEEFLEQLEIDLKYKGVTNNIEI